MSICLLLQAFDLAIDESSFTGETEPASKQVDVNNGSKRNHISQRDNVAFMGTLVRCGNGKVRWSVACGLSSGECPRIDLILSGRRDTF